MKALKSGLFHSGNGRRRVVCLSDVRCGIPGGPDSVCAKAPCPPNYSGFLLCHSQATWRLLEKRMFTKYFTSNGKYMCTKGFTNMPV